MRSVIYVRVSDQSQVDGTSLDTQEKICREYAEREGFTVAKLFREEGVSAKTLNRPEFQKLLEYVTNGKIQAVILYKMDRLSRNLYNQLIAIQDLEKSGVTLHSATENVSDTPAGKLQRNILGSFAEYDNAIRAERSRSGLFARLKEGWWVSSPPPGYDMVRGKDKRSRAMLNEMSSIILWAFDRRAEGWTFARIAEGMNNRGYRSKHGGKIREQNVHFLIQNPFYMGLLKYGGEEVWGNHEPVVSKDIWYRAQAVNEQNAHSSPSRSAINPTFPLRGLIYCSHCGERLTASRPQSRSGQHYAYYHHRQPSECPLAKSVPKAVMEKEFKSKLRQLKPRPSMFPLLKAVLLERWEERLKGHRSDQKGIGRQLDNVQKEKQNLLAGKRRNIYSDEEFVYQMEEIKGRLKALELLQTESTVENDDFEEVLMVAFDALKNPVKTWQAATIEQKVRFDRILFPQGMEYDGNSLSNHQTSLLMGILTSVSAKRENVEKFVIGESGE